jgi:hypothetical protein
MKHVKCIDNSGGADGHLVHGQIYEVKHESSAGGETYYWLENMPQNYSGPWYGYRFAVVDEEDEPTAKATLSRDCPCGIARQDCTYHRI